MVRPRTVTDAEIIEATRAILIERGPSASLSLIAASLGVTAPALIRRMGSREALLARALAPDKPPRWLATLAIPVAEADFPNALIGILREAMGFFSGLVPLLILIRTANVDLSDLVDPPRPPGRHVRLALAEWIAASRGRPRKRDPAIDSFVEAVLGAIESRCFLAYLEDRPMSPRGQTAWLKKLVVGLWPRLEIT